MRAKTISEASGKKNKKTLASKSIVIIVRAYNRWSNEPIRFNHQVLAMIMSSKHAMLEKQNIKDF